jgi:hypothetical protein
MTKKKLKNATLQMFFEVFLGNSAIRGTLGALLRSRQDRALGGHSIWVFLNGPAHPEFQDSNVPKAF